MKPISSFFERLKNLTVPDRALREAVGEALREVLGADVDPSHIHIRNGVASLSASSVLKSEVQFKQRELLSAVARVIGKQPLHRIR